MITRIESENPFRKIINSSWTSCSYFLERFHVVPIYKYNTIFILIITGNTRNSQFSSRNIFFICRRSDFHTEILRCTGGLNLRVNHLEIIEKKYAKESN